MDYLKSPVFTERVIFLQNTQYMSKEELEYIQLNKFKYLVEHVNKYIPFYRDFLKKNGLAPDDFQKIEDVKRFPIIDKRLLQENYDKFLPFNVDKNSLLHRTTGGSTGTPLTVYVNPDFNARDAANTQHYMQVFGLDIFKYKSIRLYGDRIPEDLLKKDTYWYLVENRKLVMSCYHINKNTIKTYMDKIDDFRPMYIHTRPSSILPLVNYMNFENLVLKNPIRYIICDGEYLTEGQRRKIENAFQGRVINIYGHTEGCVVAHPCPKSDNLHFMPQVGIMEFLDSDSRGVTKEGEKGEIIATGFNNLMFPLIRYRTRDIGIMGTEGCACGRSYKSLRSIEGRTQDYVVDRHANLVPLAPAVFNYNDMDWRGIREFKVFQEKEGRLTLKILPEIEMAERLNEVNKMIKEKIEAIFGMNFEIEVEFVKELNKTEIGKYRYLDQKLDMSKYF